MGDGKLRSFALVLPAGIPAAEAIPGVGAISGLGASKSVQLASQPLLLVPFTAEGGEELVFACCERPALVRGGRGVRLGLVVAGRRWYSKGY
jgi:hypothetical protein